MAEYITKEQAFELLDDGDMYARKALAEMKPADVIERSEHYERFIRAVLESVFSESKDTLIEAAVKSIYKYKGRPIMENEKANIAFFKKIRGVD